MSGEEVAQKTTFYYDPILEVHHRLPVRSALFTCFYSAAQAPSDTKRLFRAALASAKLDADPLATLKDPRGPAIALALSREWELEDLEARLDDAIDDNFEPTWNRERGEFTWGLRLGEEHPRGQYNAFLATAEAMSAGAWSRLSAAPLPPCPQVVGIDFPNVALSRAQWQGDALHLALNVLRADPQTATTFRIEGVEFGGTWTASGAARTTIAREGDALVVTTPLESGSLRLCP